MMLLRLRPSSLRSPAAACGNIKQRAADLLPMAAGGIVHGVIEPPAATPPRSYKEGVFTPY